MWGDARSMICVLSRVRTQVRITWYAWDERSLDMFLIRGRTYILLSIYVMTRVRTYMVGIVDLWDLRSCNMVSD